MNENSNFQQHVLDAMGTVELLFDNKMALRYINPAGEELFEVSAKNILGMSYPDLIQHRDDLAVNNWMKEIKSGQSFTRHEIELVLFNEKELSVNMTVIPVTGDSDFSGYLVEILSVERWLRITRDEHRAEQQQVTQEILRGLAHEVKNPLGGLRGAAQLLERELSSEDLKEYTQVIISEADRLQSLVNRILGPAGLPKEEEINIHVVLERIRNLTMMSSEGIKIHRDYDPSIPDIKADPDMIMQALLNIIQNACEAAGKEGNVTLKTRVVRKYTIGHKRHRLVLNVEVIDDGPGIPEDIKERIFFPMVTGRAEGSGLGLSISQSLIQQHDGLIECHSEPGKTVFSVILPIN